MSYSFDNNNNNNKDRWSELADEYQSMLDELNSDELKNVFIPVPHFDLDEVL